MTSVDCYRADCRWCVCGACTRGSITIDEMCECEGFESYQDSYTESYWIACSKTKKRIYKRLITRGAKIEYNGYVFYTKDMITETENYGLTEERTGYYVGTMHSLRNKDRWERFVEIVKSLPDVSSYPEWKEGKNNGEE